MQSDGLNSPLSPSVYGDIVLSINTQYNTKKKRFGHKPWIVVEGQGHFAKCLQS